MANRTYKQVNLEIYGKALLGIKPNITPLI
jgi:hypothetical protein